MAVRALVHGPFDGFPGRRHEEGSGALLDSIRAIERGTASRWTNPARIAGGASCRPRERRAGRWPFLWGLPGMALNEARKPKFQPACLGSLRSLRLFPVPGSERGRETAEERRGTLR